MSAAPITSYFKKIDLKPLNRTNDNVTEKGKKFDLTFYDLSDGNVVQKSNTGSSLSSPIVVDTEASSLTGNVPFNEIQKDVSDYKHTPEFVRCNTNVLTLSANYGSDIEMTEEVNLKDVPMWLSSPCCISSDSSDDDLLKPVIFHQSKKTESFEQNDENLLITCTSNSVTENTSTLECLCGNRSTLSIYQNDDNAPYINDLKFLIITNGTVPLKCEYSELEVTLMSYSQKETMDVILSLDFLSAALHMRKAIKYLMTNTFSQRMVHGETLVRLWKDFIEPMEVTANSELTHTFVHYFQYLIISHPPSENDLVREQYLYFLQNVHSTFIGLLVSNETWKVEVLSVIVGILLTDLYQVYHNNCLSPLFHCLYWKQSEHHFVNSTIRFLIQSAIYIYKSPDSFTKILQTEILAQLLFLVFVECEDVAMDIGITFSSLPNVSLLTALSSLVPLKLRDAVATNIKPDISVLPTSHSVVQVHFMLNKNL